MGVCSWGQNVSSVIVKPLALSCPSTENSAGHRADALETYIEEEKGALWIVSYYTLSGAEAK